jgi:hypothetical protein
MTKNEENEQTKKQRGISLKQKVNDERTRSPTQKQP